MSILYSSVDPAAALDMGLTSGDLLGGDMQSCATELDSSSAFIVQDKVLVAGSNTSAPTDSTPKSAAQQVPPALQESPEVQSGLEAGNSVSAPCTPAQDVGM